MLIETATENPTIPDIIVRLLPWDISVQELEKILLSLRGCVEGPHKNDSRYMPAHMVLFALAIQQKTLVSLNDAQLSCPVPWDARTDLPSHPSLIADMQTYIGRYHPPGAVRALLQSFASWTLLRRDTVDCSCGTFLPRTVQYETWIHHVFHVEGAGLHIKQLLGIRSGDRLHMQRHFHIKPEDRICDDLSVVWECANIIQCRGGATEVYPMQFAHDAHIDPQRLQEILHAAMQEG